MILLLKDVIINLLQLTNENPAFNSLMFMILEKEGGGGGGRRENLYFVYVIHLNVSNCIFVFKVLFLCSQHTEFKLTLYIFAELILE